MSPEKWAATVAAIVREFFEKNTSPVLARVADLERSVNELQTRRADVQTKTLADFYRGGFQPNTTYERGAVISDKGGVWLAMSDTTERPGTSSDWRLILRSRAA